MILKRERRKADLPEGAESPLDNAVERRNKSVLQMAKDAVRHKQCLLAFQPVMQSRTPNQIAFYEGFIRVLDETGRVIPAREFMPAVENTEVGRDLDCIALESGLKTLSKAPHIRLSINMSARSIGYSRWMRILERSLKRDEALGERLILEINQGSAMTVPELVIDFMDRLQDLGIAFALDDYGADPVSFSQFRDFFFDAVKIDGQFVRQVSSDTGNQAVVRSLIALAREFDMLIVAESVETEEDARFLVETGVDALQGYLFGAPSVNPPWQSDSQRRRA
ncbi:EAL domain-containing protein [Ruegeria sp. 2205SS24-7]|uniref:EAL domain-containing protein n=1 Tax=Ruegeria discodermiae TaxID=3064389 RepID=UPI002740D337|nr:EAL domain-containing protein [Ruegeria sp. 2205SS24-7]MDP5217469.1 EAL domain-containing protein [Ruegeria sp. 2205SS24-7]